jgi:uncharacterized membrane protein YidH (DUF202 family)
MTSLGQAPDRGMQPERTALAWTRTSLSVLASGVLVLLKDRSAAELDEQSPRLGIVCAAILVALAVFTVGLLRRRALEVRPLPRSLRARGAVLLVGTSILALALLMVTYLTLPLR